MANEPKAPQHGMIQVVTGDEMSRGRYSNNMLISHTPEEFIIDWLLNSPAGTHLVARVVVSPGHLKRIIGALEDNLKRYEANFGDVRLIEPKDQVFH
jgi:Protein of unknown function (DUF3467)